ncbi:MAG TPA: divalent metal cation transporter [Pyrinomonadaceae bacterium]|jgi:NRAMP (natural resistance-associated macrophage protein)-like metal ion transporter|nr:divalent metal cation transporter [Pyrinomonadaceae bacterium]
MNVITKHLKRIRTAKVRKFFGELGPGLITGAADDDPSGISTYSVAGATFGYGQLWTALFSFPLMTAVQLMCAHLGMVTGEGLARAVRRRYSPPVLWGACALLIVANTFNIGADLGGMAEVMQMTTGISAYIWLPLFTAGIIVLLVWSSYKRVVQIFKWLTLILFSYIITAFLAHPKWSDVLKATFIPQIRWSVDYLATFLGVLGTTISPYLFFWQAAQEVEEERKIGRKTVHARRGATDEELRTARTDVITGMAFSNVTMYFIILTTGATLFVSGQKDIETARQAAEALRPLAGNAAYLLFTLGLLGTGILGVPVLAGSAAYAVAEAMHWRGSLDARPRHATKFYLVLAAAMVLGLLLNFFKLSAVRMLFWSAVLNGALAPPLVALVTLLTSDKKVMESRLSSPLMQVLGWITTAVMSAATVAMIVVWWRG